MNKTKTNKGITLVALVITIIVLIILAGVSINAVLNGGIITNAKDAKNQYNEGKIKEEKEISKLNSEFTDFELEEYFAKNNISYKSKNGYLTGLEGLTVGEVRNDLKEIGYSLCDKNGSDTLADGNTVATGMAIVKNNEIVGRIVIFGDINCDGIVKDAQEANNIAQYVNGIGTGGMSNRKIEDYQKVAMDVNHDGYLNKNDPARLVEYVAHGEPVEQNAYAGNPDDLIIQGGREAIEKYITELPETDTNYKLEWSEADGIYLLKGAIAEETTVGDIINGLGLSSTPVVKRKGGKIWSALDETATVLKGDRIWIQDPYYDLGGIILADIDC